MADQVFNVKCGFFDSVSSDRLYTAEEMNRPYKRLISNGVFATPKETPSTDLQVLSASDGMKIIVKKGEGLFGDKWFENQADFTIVVPNNANIVPRRDSVIVQVDKRQSGRVGSIVYREGTPASSPMPPNIGTVDNVVEYRVANIYVAAGATTINQDAITDLRGSSECPWVTSLIKQVDTSTLYIQWEAAFNTWFNTIKETLATSTLIRSYNSTYTTVAKDETVIPINISQFNKELDIFQVYINGLKLIPGLEYTLNSNTKITLAEPVDIGTPISFEVFKSIDGSDAETVVSQVSSLESEVDQLSYDTGWINFTLESGATAFDSTSTPAVRKFGNQIFIRGAIKGLDTVNSTIVTLPTTMRPAVNHQYAAIAFANNTIAANCVIEVKTTGAIAIVAKSGTIPTNAMLPIATQFIIG